MTTQHRALIEQMLEALDSVAAYGSQNAECARIGYKAREAAREYLAAPEQSEPVLYQFRNIVEGEPRTEWEEVKPRNPHMGTVQDQINDLLAYRYRGMPSYEVRALYLAPQPTTPEPVNQMLLNQLESAANYIDHLGGVSKSYRILIAAAEQATQPTELSDDEMWVLWDAFYADTVRYKRPPFELALYRDILAAQKGTK